MLYNYFNTHTIPVGKELSMEFKCKSLRELKGAVATAGLRLPSRASETVKTALTFKVWPTEEDKVVEAKKFMNSVEVKKLCNKFYEEGITAVNKALNAFSAAVRSCRESGSTSLDKIAAKLADSYFKVASDSRTITFAIEEGGYFVIQNDFTQWKATAYSIKHKYMGSISC